ncbi:MAG: phosphotransferase [Armatimonas sp.]
MPDAVAFREAVQNVGTLGHPRLASGILRLDKLGLPVVYTGRFAVVFRLTDRLEQEWALRFFTTPERPGQLPRALRYALIDAHLEKLPHRFVEFQFHERGIRISRQWEPLVAMGWASGTTLGRWVVSNLHAPEKLRALAEQLDEIRAEFESAGIAHGDWQHDNLLLNESGDEVVFVDYDGMFVPELAGTDSPERGHPNYQHPARCEKHYGVGLDRFACLVIRTALLALAVDPALERRFGDPDRLLFGKQDFEHPATSPLFAALKALDSPELTALLNEMEAALAAGGDSELLPMPGLAGATLTELAKLAQAGETNAEIWEQTADKALPWWRSQVASRHVQLPARWAELLRSLEQARTNARTTGSFDSKVWEPILQSALQTVQEEQEPIGPKISLFTQALRQGIPELALGISQVNFVVQWMERAKVPATLYLPKLEAARITTAAKLLRHRDFLPKFLRERERAPLLEWAENEELKAQATYKERLSSLRLEEELKSLYLLHDSLTLAENRLRAAVASL